MKKNPVLKFVLIRLGLFIAAFSVMYAIGIDPFFSALYAAVIGLAVSLLFFNKQRAEVSAAIERWVQRKSDRDTAAEDSTAEDTAGEDLK
ncbi:MAG: DUF4229 domain-containing protein [Micrococcales bacterium]